VALFGRQKHEQPVSIDSEYERLRAIRVAAEEELGRLRRELTERVAVVEKRERELADALNRIRQGGFAMSVGDAQALAHAQTGLAAHAHELNRRELELESRESLLYKMEADLTRRAAAAAETPEERLEHIEKRLATLHEAEKAFARTQAELAARSADLSNRAAALAEIERSGVVDGGGPTVPSRAELAELEERLRRLERETRDATASSSFGETLRSLEQKGLRGGSAGQ
jgi:DNA repair exonuclease SbcCD ATPase subunit